VSLAVLLGFTCLVAFVYFVYFYEQMMMMMMMMKLYTVINSLSANHAYLKTLYCIQLCMKM